MQLHRWAHGCLAGTLALQSSLNSVQAIKDIMCLDCFEHDFLHLDIMRAVRVLLLDSNDSTRQWLLNIRRTNLGGLDDQARMHFSMLRVYVRCVAASCLASDFQRSPLLQLQGQVTCMCAWCQSCNV